MSSQRPHILVLTKWYPNPSDLQLGVFVKNQALLASNSYKVTVIYVQTGQHHQQPYDVRKTTKDHFSEIHVYYKKSRFLRKVNHIFKYRKAQKIGLSHIDTPVDICHVHVPIRPSFLALGLQKKKKTPFIITEHWSGHLNGQFKHKLFAYQFLYKKVLSKATRITAVSEPLATQISKLSRRKTILIPNYIQEAELITNRHTKGHINIISVSDLNNHTKNITGLLEAFKLAIQANKHLVLTIVGDGPDKALIETEIERLDLRSSVHLAGRKTQDEVLALLPKFDFYICNSNVETFGMAVAEALMAGLPVVSTRCGGPEAFVNESNGLLTAVDDYQKLSESILNMSKSYTSYDPKDIQLAIKKRYGASHVLEQWETLYQTILNE